MLIAARLHDHRECFRLIEEDDGWWSAVDQETGVANQGETQENALENLDDAVEVTNA